MTANVTAIVTGHSRGLGAAIASELLERGAEVLGLARFGNDRLAGRLEEVTLDLARPDAVVEALSATGPVHRFLAAAGAGTVVLINNAGMVEPVGPAGTLDAKAIARAVALNVTAPLLLSDAFIAATQGAADRRILHVSSGAARQPYAGWSIYCATKAALDHHARSVAADARPGLRIASVAPGVVDTEMQATLRATPPERFVLRDRFVALQETGSLTRPEEAARALVNYLLMPAFGDEQVTDIRNLGTAATT